MRILVHEHLTATAPPDAPSHLLRQGEAMIQALLEDLRAVRAAAITVFSLPADRTDVLVAWDEALQAADAVWPIAPETGGWLEALSRQVLARGRILLGSRPEAVQVAGSKLLAWQALQAAGVPAVPTSAHWRTVVPPDGWLVAKPDDGAGCEHTYLLRAGTTWPSLPVNAVFQPYVRGAPRSFAMLCTAAGAELLCVNAQRVALRAGVFHFEGVDTDIDRASHGRVAALAAAVHAAIPGLRGFVGVDYIESAAGALVLEVNPRLTTAYAGLSARLGCNLAARVLRSLGRGETMGKVAGEAAT